MKTTGALAKGTYGKTKTGVNYIRNGIKETTPDAIDAYNSSKDWAQDTDLKGMSTDLYKRIKDTLTKRP